MPQVISPQARLLAGVARVDITPPPGIYHRMWGAASHDRSSGIHRPLTATALALAPLDGEAQAGGAAEKPVVLVTLDHCLLWAREMEALESSVAERTGVERQRLLIGFSHTHAAGLMGLERRELPGGDLIPTYLDELAGKVSAIVEQSLHASAPAWISFGVGRSDLAAHRDFWDGDSKQFVCGYNPDGAADDTLVVARLVDEHGRILGTLVNYACHPTTLAWQNTLISPDYVGAMRELVESATGGAPCAFFQGASGDLGPREGFTGDVAVADRNGRRLGHAVCAVLDALPPHGTRYEYTGAVVSGATIGTWDYSALAGDEAADKARWAYRRWTVPLAYRDDLGTADEARREIARLETVEQRQRASRDEAAAADTRALVERLRRKLVRLETLPAGDTFPMPAAVLRTGDGLWVAVEGEYYQAFQQRVREQFRGVPIVVMTLVGGSRPTYLPTAETYGRGIYQESIAVLARGSLEAMIDEISRALSQIGRMA